MNIETIRKLATLAHTAPSADNSQPWKLSWDSGTLSIGYDSKRVAGRTFPADSPATLLSMGAVIEIIMMAANDWQLQAVLELEENLPCASTGAYARITFKGGDDNAPSNISTHPATLRHSNRLDYLNQTPPPDLYSALELLRENDARVILFDNDKDIHTIADIVKSATQIRFQTREVHQWLDKSLRFSRRSAARGDGMDVATLGLPPGGKLFLRLISSWDRMKILNKLGIYKIVAKIDAAPVKAAPALMAIAAPCDKKGTLDAGRLLCRAWILANSRGLSAHPYYVIADQLARLRSGSIPEQLYAQALATKTNTKKVCKLRGEETLHMLFRVGYSKKTPKPAQRLPLDQVYNEKTTCRKTGGFS